MIKNIYIILILITSVTACKNNKSESTELDKNDSTIIIDATKENEDFDSMKLIIETKFANPDILEIFYNEHDDKFSHKRSLKTNVLGGNEIQKSIFIIPNKTLASQFRFDFGETENQETTILKITIELEGKSFVIPQNKIMASFNSSPWVEIINTETALIKPKKHKDRIDSKLNFNINTVNELRSFFEF